MSGRTDYETHAERDADIATVHDAGDRPEAEDSEARPEGAGPGDRPEGALPGDRAPDENPGDRSGDDGPEDRPEGEDPESASGDTDAESVSEDADPERQSEDTDLDGRDDDEHPDGQDDDEDVRRARWTATGTGGLLTLAGLAAALLRWTGSAPVLAPAAYALGAVVCALAAVLGHRGRTRRALWLLIAGVMVMAVGDQFD
ncbi:hypothetical protein ACWCQK_24640 [Streptomyces sp. NPDC002306]